MYQKELFEGLAKQHGQHIGVGLYANVWKMTDGNVCKVSRFSDGTRNWLELCAMHTAAGTLMPLMPEVFSVVPCNDGYMAIMPCYEDSCDYQAKLASYSIRDEVGYSEVSEYFNEYMHANSDGTRDWTYFDDVYSGNYMWCPRRGWVITDPCCSHYAIKIASEELVLN